MLPEKLQNLDDELSEEEIRSTIIIQTTRFLQETFLLKKNQGNVTLDHQLINLQASFLFRIRSHERSRQIKQKELVSLLLFRMWSKSLYPINNKIVFQRFRQKETFLAL